MSTGETTVGSIVGFLRLDAQQFHEQVAQAIAELKMLSGEDVNIKVKSDGIERLPASARAASNGLSDLEREARRVEDATSRVNIAQLRLSELQTSGRAKASQIAAAEVALAKARRVEQDAIMGTYAANLALTGAMHGAADAEGRAKKSTDDLNKSSKESKIALSGMWQAAILVGPALVPIAAAAVGVSLGLAGMGAAGILAFEGIKREMKTGTQDGQAFSAGVRVMSNDLSQLEAVAAHNVLGSFQVVVRDLNAQMPLLSRSIGTLAAITGHTASAIVTGLLHAFQVLQPYIVDSALQIDVLVTKFSNLSNSNGLRTFGAYMSSVMPSVIQFLTQIITAVMHLAAALAPFGTGILQILIVFIQVLNAMPIGTLTILAQLALSVFAGFKTWEAITGIVEGVVETLKALNTTLEITEGVLRIVDIAAGAVGLAVAAFSLILAHNAQVAEEAKAKQDEFAQALRQSNGVINDSIREIAAKQLVDAGAADTAKTLGISLSTATSAALGNKEAVASVNATIDAYIKSGTMAVTTGQTSIVIQTAQAKAAQKLRDQLFGTTSALSDEIKHQALLRAATQPTTASMTAQEIATGKLAAKYGMSVSAYEAATSAQKKNAESLAVTTNKMVLENDAAGLLKQALDRLNGVDLNLAQAQTAAASATLAVTKSLKDNGKSLSLNSEKGVQNRQMIEAKVQADQALAEATATATKSTVAGTKSLADSKAQLERTLKSQGLLTDAVKRYIDKLYAVSAIKVKPTRLDIDKRAADSKLSAFQREINSLHGTTVSVNVLTSGIAAAAHAANVIATLQSMKHLHGGIDHFRDGGIRGIQAFADGGMLPKSAMIAPDGANLIQWAERGTGGEAFIPLAPSNHARSVAIWEETGRLLGVQASAAESLKGVEITGTLQTPWGPSQIKAVVKSELREAAAQSRVTARQRNGVNR